VIGIFPLFLHPPPLTGQLQDLCKPSGREDGPHNR
jgi:hypothetical protein